MLTTQALTVRAPMHVGRLALRNRIYRAPVLEGAGSAIDPAGEYIRHFVPNAETGTGLIIQGNTIVLPEGRTSPGMSAIAERSSMLALARVPEAVHAAGGRIVIQLGHGGIFALESWHRAFKRDRAQPPLAPSTPPWWLRPTHGRVHKRPATTAFNSQPATPSCCTSSSARCTTAARIATAAARQGARRFSSRSVSR
ncbi:MAG: oxidoreductase [Planctomycetota bacterium]